VTTQRLRRLTFGEVADVYHEVRAGYPEELIDAILDYCDGAPVAVAEIGAGTGLATASLLARGLAVEAIEPDPEMAAVLRRRFPDVAVRVRDFEAWTPPPGRVDLLACASAWHWLAPQRRLRLAADALRPGGVLAVFGHSYRFADDSLHDAIIGVYARHAPELLAGDAEPPEPEPISSPTFTDAALRRFTMPVDYPTERYLALLSTFSNHRMLPPERFAALLDDARAVIDAAGGVVSYRMPAVLSLARRVPFGVSRESVGPAW
jgi:trans-aconitate methyltransferase